MPESKDHELRIHDLEQQYARIDKFIETAELPIEYISGIILKNKKRAEMYEHISTFLLGSLILSGLTYFGGWILTKLRELIV